MLKRYQVLLDDWLADFIKERAEKHDASFSEVIRIALCVYYGGITSEFYPEYEYEFTLKKMASCLKKFAALDMSEDVIHKMISDIYFETRKALEYFKEQNEKGTRLGSK